MDNDTKSTLGIVKYEWAMFQSTADLLIEHNQANALNERFKNAILESFLIHARLIHEFIRKRGYKDNLTAKELVEDADVWDKKIIRLFPKLGRSQHIGGVEFKYGYYDLIHKHLAHLTKARIGFKPKWPISEIYDECKNAFMTFLHCLDTNRRKYIEEI